MASVTVVLGHSAPDSWLARWFGQKRRQFVVRAKGATVEEALRDVTRTEPELFPPALLNNGLLQKRRSLAVFLNENDVFQQQGLDTLIQNDDEITVVAAVSSSRPLGESWF